MNGEYAEFWNFNSSALAFWYNVDSILWKRMQFKKKSKVKLNNYLIFNEFVGKIFPILALCENGLANGNFRIEKLRTNISKRNFRNLFIEMGTKYTY